MSVQDEAKKWIDNLQADGGLYGSWRLQVLEQKTRVVDKDADPVEMKQSPVRIRRFAKGIPRPLVDAAIRYLISLAPYTGVLYDGVPCEGTFVPVTTRWVRDDNVAVESGRADNRYTIIQDLVEISELDSLGVTTSESCSEVVTTEYVWDAASVGELPIDGAFSQGTTVSVQGVSRDSDGNINYAVVTRTAKTTVTGPTVQECDEFGTTTVTVWDNVYGEGVDGDPFRADTDREAADDGSGVKRRTLPCDHADGVVVTEQITRNDDCTYRIVHTEKTSNEVETEHSESSTIYEKVESDTTRATAVDNPIHVHPAEPSSADGTVNDVRVELRPDGKYDVVDRTRTERPVEGSTVETRKTLRGVRTTTKSRNQVAPVSGSGAGGALKIGESISNTKTDSGRYDTVHEVVAYESVGVVQADHRGTIFKDSVGVRRNEDGSYFSDSGPGGGVTFKPGSSHDVDDGVITDVSSTATEEGTFDNDRTVTTEHNREYAEIEYRKTLKSSRKTIIHRNRSRVTGPDDVVTEADVEKSLVPADGIIDENSNLKIGIGDKVRLTRTDGDRVDVILERVDLTDEVGVTGATSQPSKFDVVNTVTGNYPDYDSILNALYPKGPPDDFDFDKWDEFMSLGGSGDFELPSSTGSSKSISIQRTEEGTYDVTVTTKTAKGDGGGTTWSEQVSTPWEYKYTVHFRNVAPGRIYDVLGNFDDITKRQSAMAMYANTKAPTESPKDPNLYPGVSAGTNQYPGDFDVPRDKAHRRLVQLWDDGARPSSDTYRNFVTEDVWKQGLPWVETGYLGDANAGNKPGITVGGEPPNFSQLVSWKLTKWFSGHVDDFFASYHRGADGNIDATFNLNEWVTCIPDWTCPPSSHDVSVSISMNDLGYLDGSAVFTAKWSPESPGQEAVLGEGVYFAYRIGNVVMVSGRGFESLIRLWTYQHSFMTTTLGTLRSLFESRVDKMYPDKDDPVQQKYKERAMLFWDTAVSYRLVARGSSLSFDPITKSWHATMNCEGNTITSVQYMRTIESEFLDYVNSFPAEVK